MKVITVIKGGAGGNGISQATRYVSRRERDEAREGLEPRRLFSTREDDLSFHQANRLLGDGVDPKTDDVIHLVISLEKEEDFNRLGIDEESRQKGLRDTTRDAAEKMAEYLNAEKIRWVAGIHRNTDNPHVHLLVHRDYTDHVTKRMKRLQMLPKEMRVSWEKAKDGGRIINPGSLSQAFERFLGQRMEKAKPVERPGARVEPAMAKNDSEERVLLGRAIIAEDKVEQLALMRDHAIKHGEKFRFEFTDGRGRSRGFSEHDIHQRAWARAIQKTTDLPAMTPELRRRMREGIVTEELKRNGELLSKHRETRRSDLTNIEIKLERAMESSRHLIEKASAIRTRYEASGTPAPTPILPRVKLGELQDSAIERSDTERIRKLEEIRLALAAEIDSPTRTETEVGRLKAQLFVAQASLTAEQESARKFEENKHLLRWDLNKESEDSIGREGGVKNSLAEIERLLIWEMDQARFIGSRYVHWNDGRRREAQTNVENLTRQRELVLDRIRAERAAISDQVGRKAELVSTLYRIHSKEERRVGSEDREMSPPFFSLNELKALDAVAARLRDPDFHRAFAQLERDYDARMDPRELVSIATRTARAQARQCLAKINLREAELHLERFHEHRERIDVIVNDDGGRKIDIARITDVKPRPPLETLFRPLITRDNRSSEIALAIEAYGERLTEEHKKASEIHHFLVDEARAYRDEFARTRSGQPMPKPYFNSWEISKLELHAARETDTILKAKYEKLYCDALQSEHEERPRKILIEKDAGNLLDPVSAVDQSARPAVPGLYPSPLSPPAHQPEMSFER